MTKVSRSNTEQEVNFTESFFITDLTRDPLWIVSATQRFTLCDMNFCLNGLNSLRLKIIVSDSNNPDSDSSSRTVITTNLESGLNNITDIIYVYSSITIKFVAVNFDGNIENASLSVAYTKKVLI